MCLSSWGMPQFAFGAREYTGLMSAALSRSLVPYYHLSVVESCIKYTGEHKLVSSSGVLVLLSNLN